MKKFIILISLVCVCHALKAQTLFTYGSNSVSKDEFLRAYNKNKTAVADKSKALHEYLDLYIKFKLKVKAAQDMRLDTLPSLTADLQNFRGQIEESFLSDDKEVSKLVQEAFIRSQKDIHVSHLLIPLTLGIKVADSLQAVMAAQTAYTEASNNKSFAQISEDLNKRSIHSEWADVGYITVFSLPYAFENIIYQLQPGQVSKPYRTKNSYHIFKNIEERKAAGKYKVAQILISYPADANNEEKLHAKKLGDSLYTALLAGADFSQTAKNFSNDKMTFINGGELPEFGVGKFTPAFENKVLSLQKDGEILPPFETEFGVHIIKRLGHTPIPADKNDVAYTYSLKQQVLQDTRMEQAKEKFLKDILKRTHFKRNNINETELWKITDTFVLSGKKISSPSINEKTVLHSFDNGVVRVSDWLYFAAEYKNTSGLYKGESDKELMEKYISTSAFDNYRKRLQQFNPDFKYQLQEFKEGNMLFEVMERNVWSKAANDSSELKNYFDKAKNKYTWNESADAILVSAANEKVAADAVHDIKSGKNWKKIMEDGNTRIQADSGRYELKQLPVNEKVKLSEGIITEPVINTADGTASFVQILKLYPRDQPRNFEEARGLVINDYQNLLEERWIEQLKKKYPVKVNEPVFQSLLH